MYGGEARRRGNVRSSARPPVRVEIRLISSQNACACPQSRRSSSISLLCHYLEPDVSVGAFPHAGSPARDHGHPAPRPGAAILATLLATTQGAPSATRHPSSAATPPSAPPWRCSPDAPARWRAARPCCRRPSRWWERSTTSAPTMTISTFAEGTCCTPAMVGGFSDYCWTGTEVLWHCGAPPAGTAQKAWPARKGRHRLIP